MKTSIVILTHNQLELTKACLNSIRQYTTEEYELVVVDNGSADETVAYLQAQPDVKLIVNDRNLGFAKGCNQGVKISTGEAILFLNNDTVVTKNWLGNMLQLLYSDEKVGMVGPVTNYCSGPQQIPVTYGSLDELNEFAQRYCTQHAGRSADFPRLVGFCLLAKKSVLDDIGLFDERFGLGGYEDDDLCLRAINNGYTLKIAFDSFIHHVGHATFKDLGVDAYKIQLENYQKAKEKWGEDIHHLLFPHTKPVLPKVSILIPTYNRPKYFELALQSALAQTYKNVEIVVCDNSENGETEQIAEKFLVSHPSIIRYFRNEENIGPLGNMQKCFNIATGEFVNYLMDDDLFHPEKIEKMMRYFLEDKEEKITVVTSHRQLIDDSGKELPDWSVTRKLYERDTRVYGIHFGTFVLRYNFNCIGEPTTVLFRKKDLMEPFGEFCGRQYGCNVDQAAWLNLLSKGDIIYIAQTLSYFRIHNEQQLSTTRSILQGAADYAHEILSSPQKGFLQNKEEYLEAIAKCKNYASNVLNQVGDVDDLELQEVQKFYELLNMKYEELLKK